MNGFCIEPQYKNLLGTTFWLGLYFKPMLIFSILAITNYKLKICLSSNKYIKFNKVQLVVLNYRLYLFYYFVAIFVLINWLNTCLKISSWCLLVLWLFLTICLVCFNSIFKKYIRFIFKRAFKYKLFWHIYIYQYGIHLVLDIIIYVMNSKSVFFNYV